MSINVVRGNVNSRIRRVNGKEVWAFGAPTGHIAVAKRLTNTNTSIAAASRGSGSSPGLVLPFESAERRIPQINRGFKAVEWMFRVQVACQNFCMAMSGADASKPKIILQARYSIRKQLLQTCPIQKVSGGIIVSIVRIRT